MGRWRSTALGVWLFVAGLGCPLEDDPLAGSGSSSHAPAQPGDGGAPDGGARDALFDAGLRGDDDAERDGGSDAGRDAGEEPESFFGDAGQENLADPDASLGEPGAADEVDAGDAGAFVEEDPDVSLFALDLDDDLRARLIAKHLATETASGTWFPLLEPTSFLRPLAVTPSHGAAVRVFVNQLAHDAVELWVAQDRPLPLSLPYGSIVAKQTYKLDDTGTFYEYASTLIMVKIDGLDPVEYEGRWFYVRDGPSGASRSTSCVGCHNGRKARSVWPPNPELPEDPGGLADAIVPYDYLWILYCNDSRTGECSFPL